MLSPFIKLNDILKIPENKSGTSIIFCNFERAVTLIVEWQLV